MSTSLTPAAPYAATVRPAERGTAPPAAGAPLHGDQLLRATLPLVFAYLGALLYGAYLLDLVSVWRSDWLARLLLACFTLPGVLQGSAAVRAVGARRRGAAAPGWWRIGGHAVRAAGGVVLAFTLVALPPHTALYVGTPAVLLTLGETAWSLTEAGAAWRGLRAGRPLGRRGRALLLAGAVALLALPAAVAATATAPLAAARARARELPVRATLETAVASLRDTRRRANAALGLAGESAALSPYPFDTVGLAADLGRRPVPGVRVAYWTTAGGGFVATATRVDGLARCVALLFPAARRELWCGGDVAVPPVFRPLLRPAAPAPARAWHWPAGGA